MANDDPLAAMAGLVAIVVVWNQPFYPLYVWWVAGPVVWPPFYTFFSPAFFAAVPWVARRSSFAGRLMLPLVGIGNTLVTTKVFGIEAGVETFLIPIALLGVVLMRPAERWYGLGIAGLCFAAFFWLHDRYGPPVHVYGPEELAALLSMNALSAGCLTVFVGLLVAGQMRPR